MNISFIIPNYNGKQLLEKNLSSVISSVSSYKDGIVEVIISDDHSKDDSFIYLQEFAKKYSSDKLKVLAVQNTHDRGFSKNVNFAVSHATGDILMLLNTDVSVDKGFLSSLLTHFSDEKVFAVGCAESTTENGNAVVYGRSTGRFVRGFIQHSARVGTGTTTFWVSCGSGAFRKKIWDKLGGLDEIYNPFYWEDIDISYRAVKSGYKILYESTSIVHHDHAEGAIKSSVSQTKVTKIAYRNQCIFIWKNITDATLLSQHIIWLPYYLIKACVRDDVAFLQGFLSAIFLLPKIIQSRVSARKTFVVSDTQILAQQA